MLGNRLRGLQGAWCASPRLPGTGQCGVLGARGARRAGPLTCAWVPRALPAPGRCSGARLRPRVGALRSRPARSHLRVPARRAGRRCISGGGGARRRGGRTAGGQGGLAGAGCRRRALPSGRKAPRPGNAERGSASPGRFRARDRGHEESEKNPSGSRAPAAGSPPGWLGGAAPAEIAQREGSGFPSGLGSRVRGGRVGKGRRLPAAAPSTTARLGEGPPSVLPSGNLCLWVTEQVLAESSPNRLWRHQLTGTQGTRPPKARPGPPARGGQT